MSAVAIQQHLDLGAEDHLSLLHHAHDSNIVIAVNACNQWTERVLPKPDAIRRAVELERHGIADSYCGQNPIKYGKARAVNTLSCLSSCYVDLDTYNIKAFAGLDKPAILQRILTDNPDMPTPTMYADSGRGMYLVWTFTRTKPVSFLPHWQQIENNLVEQLKPYGADPKCSDAARVLRISGTENSKALKAAGYVQIGEPVSYETLQKYSNRLTAKHKTQVRQHALRNKTGKVVRLKTGFANKTKNTFTLAHQRMTDIQTLAILRGGRLTDLRKTALFAYAVSAAWYCYTTESLEAALKSFAYDYLCNPEEYVKHLPVTVIRRHTEGLNGETIQWNGQEKDKRYTARNSTLIDWLQITPEEQRQMTCLIGKDEKNRRNNAKRKEKRRQAGRLDRSQYEQAAQERRQQVLELAASGMSNTDIAQTVGVTVRHVQRYKGSDKYGSLYNPKS